MRSIDQSPNRPAPRGAGRLALCLLLALLVGCGSRKPPAPPDPAEARVALRKVLDAWQKGVRPEGLLGLDPPMVASDYEWDEGRQLEGYELLGDGEMRGNTLRCKVLLQLEATPGQPQQREATYFVATTPKISVVREFE